MKCKLGSAGVDVYVMNPTSFSNLSLWFVRDESGSSSYPLSVTTVTPPQFLQTTVSRLPVFGRSVGVRESGTSVSIVLVGLLSKPVSHPTRGRRTADIITSRVVFIEHLLLISILPIVVFLAVSWRDHRLIFKITRCDEA